MTSSPAFRLLSAGAILIWLALLAPAAARVEGDAPPARPRPANQPAQGLIYDGLEPASTGPCAGMFRISGTDLCTHGPDAPPPGINFFAPATPIAGAEANQPQDIVCDGNGIRGRRVQVMYVRADDREDRYRTFLGTIQAYAAQMDEIYLTSAQETGGSRRIRFVTEKIPNGCAVNVLNITVSATSDDTFGAIIADLRQQGYNRPDRIYALFVDGSGYCGIGTLDHDDSPGLDNANNVGSSYARVDLSCWGGRTMSHELGHNLGAVQFTAPNTSGGGHCVDEYDLMCYSDSPNYPPMVVRCLDQIYNSRLDCKHDDYYHTNPDPSSYLATHWNSANNSFLIGAPDPPPYAPLGLRVAAVGSDAITLEWENHPEASNYKLYRYKEPEGFVFHATIGAELTTFTDSGLNCTTAHFYRLTAINDSGESPPGGVVSAQTGSCQATPTATPTSATATPTSGPSATPTATPGPTGAFRVYLPMLLGGQATAAR